MNRSVDWPELPYEEWKDTLAALHRWAQIVGKIRLERTPWINHSWHVPLYVTARGLGSSLIPAGDRGFELAFDFRKHVLEVVVSDGGRGVVALERRSVASFHDELMELLGRLGVATSIFTTPSEIPEGVPFDEDTAVRDYDAAAVERFGRVLVAAHGVFQRFRARFVGKSSPVHFFWGSFDLAVTRFSGRRAPEHPGGIPALPDWVARESYSHEVHSLGFWPGGDAHPHPVFYAYAYPTPDGFAAASAGPRAAAWSGDLGEFLLPYDAVRGAADPAAEVLAFGQHTYDAAARLAHWDREALEWPGGAEGPSRP